MIQQLKSLMISFLVVVGVIWAIEVQQVNLASWQNSLFNAPLLLFVAAMILALRFNQTKLIYPSAFLLTCWLVEFNIGEFGYLNFNEHLLMLSQLFILCLFSFDSNKSLWGRHGFIRLLVVLTVLFINYRFNQSITVQSWLSYPLLTASLSLGNIYQIPLLLSLVAILAIVIRQVSNSNKITLNAALTSMLITYAHMLDLSATMSWFLWLLIGGLFIQGILSDSYRMAFSDELTGLSARRALLQSSLSLGKKYTVAMLDVDHFKKFNDTYGHDIGDQVLKMVASRLDKVKGGGKAYRYGGEEFTIVFANKSVNYAIPYLEQVRQAIEDYQMVIRQQDRPDDTKEGKSQRNKATSSNKSVSVTISIGVAEREGEAKDFDQVLKVADEALYRAKQAGRNCIAE